jgi:hypothetical protein
MTKGIAPFSSMLQPMVETMPNKEKALLHILRHLNGKGVEEVADHILALFNAPQRWKPEDQQEVYRVSDCGEIRGRDVSARRARLGSAVGLWELLQEQEGRRTCP